MSNSEEKPVFWGDKCTVHYNDDGQKIGESREKTGFWGNSHTEHTNPLCSKTGESREKSDFRGDSYKGHEGSRARGWLGTSCSIRGSSSGGSSTGSTSGYCFTATACLGARSLPDNCFELEELCRFRDQYVPFCRGGAQLIADYYRGCP